MRPSNTGGQVSMGLYGGGEARNHGWGRSMSYAGRQALDARYAGGHFGTVATHAERWDAFCGWAKEQGVRRCESRVWP